MKQYSIDIPAELHPDAPMASESDNEAVLTQRSRERTKIVDKFVSENICTCADDAKKCTCGQCLRGWQLTFDNGKWTLTHDTIE